jgi:hypothetical protein
MVPTTYSTEQFRLQVYIETNILIDKRVSIIILYFIMQLSTTVILTPAVMVPCVPTTSTTTRAHVLLATPVQNASLVSDSEV